MAYKFDSMKSRVCGWMMVTALVVGCDTGEGEEGSDETDATDGTSTDPDGGSDPTGTPGTSGDPTGDETGTPDTGDETSAEGPASLEECIAESVIDVECGGDEPAFSYVAWSESLGCSGALGATEKQALVLTSLAMTPEGGEPPVLGMRIAGPGAALPEDVLEQILPTPVPYGMFTPELPGLTVFVRGLPLVFTSAEGEGRMDLTAVPPLEALLAGGETIEGTFELTGAAVLVPDATTPVDDPSFAMRGCFRLPGDLHPIELD
jgi:hypothetical protein